MSRPHPGCLTGGMYEHILCVRLSGRACIECGEPAGTAWGPYFCPDCDVERLDRIDASLEEIRRSFNDGC